MATILFCLAGCSTFDTYIKDRALDFVDCFHCDAGVGFGLEAHFIATDAFSYCIGTAYPTKYGFIGRYVGTWKDEYHGFPICNYDIWYNNVHYTYIINNKWVDGPTLNWSCLLLPFPIVSTMLLFEKDNDRNFVVYSSILAINVFKGVNDTTDLSFFDLLDAFRFEAGVTMVYFGAAIGFNGGQFADFLLGWFGIDIADDDTNAVQKPKLGNPN
jgi:hypothetical protein